MQEHEMRGLLGPAYDGTTDEQREQVQAVADALTRRYPDDAESGTLALSTALAVVLGDDTVEAAGSRYVASQTAADRAQTELTGALIAGDAIAGSTRGVQADLSRRSGVSLPTVRKALGL